MADVVLYKEGLDLIMRQFCQLVSRETSLPELSATIEQMKTYPLLEMLMKDPTDERTKICIRQYIGSSSRVPHEFLQKFLAIINLKINLAPNNTGFINQSYNAKVIANNIRPPTKITTFTLDARKERFWEDIRTTTTHQYVHRNIPETVRLKFDGELLKKCINTLGDLNRTIQEGNRANDYQIDEYIHTNISK